MGVLDDIEKLAKPVAVDHDPYSGRDVTATMVRLDDIRPHIWPLEQQLLQVTEERDEYRRDWHRVVSEVRCPACNCSTVNLTADNKWNCHHCKYRWDVSPHVALRRKRELKEQLTRTRESLQAMFDIVAEAIAAGLPVTPEMATARNRAAQALVSTEYLARKDDAHPQA